MCTLGTWKCTVCSFVFMEKCTVCSFVLMEKCTVCSCVFMEKCTVYSFVLMERWSVCSFVFMEKRSVGFIIVFLSAWYFSAFFQEDEDKSDAGDDVSKLDEESDVDVTTVEKIPAYCSRCVGSHCQHLSLLPIWHGAQCAWLDFSDSTTIIIVWCTHWGKESLWILGFNPSPSPPKCPCSMHVVHDMYSYAHSMGCTFRSFFFFLCQHFSWALGVQKYYWTSNCLLVHLIILARSPLVAWGMGLWKIWALDSLIKEKTR